MNFVADLEARGLIHQMTEPDFREELQDGQVTGYIGFDPTASSLHVGSLLQVLLLVRLQRAGHRPIAIVGGGTGMIGDPSGKTAERSMLDEATLAENLAGMRAQLERFLDFDGPRGALLLNNADWLGAVSMIDFLRDVGKHFSVNAMIARDSVKMRLETREHGISYTEFSYMLLQAYDFLVLHDQYGCTLQMGGSDQWGNIVSGKDLIRRLRNKEVFGLTSPLITRSDGKKFGKTERGNVWLDAERTSPYELYQFWYNSSDADVTNYLKYLTLLDLDTITELERAVESDPGAREAQLTLARNLTEMVHGAEALRQAEHTTEVLHGGGDITELSAAELKGAFMGSPSTTIPRAQLGTEDASLVAVCADSGLCPSRGQAKKTIKSGAISVNHRRIDDMGYVLGAGDLIADRYVVLRRGRKTYHVVEVG